MNKKELIVYKKPKLLKKFYLKKINLFNTITPTSVYVSEQKDVLFVYLFNEFEFNFYKKVDDLSSFDEIYDGEKYKKIDITDNFQLPQPIFKNVNHKLYIKDSEKNKYYFNGVFTLDNNILLKYDIKRD